MSRQVKRMRYGFDPKLTAVWLGLLNEAETELSLAQETMMQRQAALRKCEQRIEALQKALACLDTTESR